MDDTNIAGQGPRALARLLTAVRELSWTPELPAAFDRIATLCVEHLSDGCLVSVVEGDDAPWHVARGTTCDLESTRALPSAHEIRSTRHAVTCQDVIVPIVAPSVQGVPDYDGRLLLRWDSSPGPTAADLALAQVVVDHAVTAIQAARTAQQLLHDRTRVANLEIALETNRDIGMAIGIVMARHLVSSDEAFSLLRRVSQLEHRKLRDVASEVVLTGCLPSAADALRVPAYSAS